CNPESTLVTEALVVPTRINEVQFVPNCSYRIHPVVLSMGGSQASATVAAKPFCRKIAAAKIEIRIFISFKGLHHAVVFHYQAVAPRSSGSSIRSSPIPGSYCALRPATGLAGP